MVVIIYFYIDYKYKATTWYLTGFPNGSNLGSTVLEFEETPQKNPPCHLTAETTFGNVIFNRRKEKIQHKSKQKIKIK